MSYCLYRGDKEMNEQEMLRVVDDQLPCYFQTTGREIQERGRKTSDLIDDFTDSLEK